MMRATASKQRAIIKAGMEARKVVYRLEDNLWRAATDIDNTPFDAKEIIMLVPHETKYPQYSSFKVKIQKIWEKGDIK